MDLFPFGNPLLAKIYENMYIFKYPLDYKWKFNQLLVDTKASYSIINISDFPTTLPQNTQCFCDGIRPPAAQLAMIPTTKHLIWVSILITQLSP